MKNARAMKNRYESIFPHLNERQRRIVAAVDAQELGRGGITAVADASGLSRPTIHKGIKELRTEPLPLERIRQPGGGRKKVEEKDPKIFEALELLIDPATRGDPMSPLKWTCKSTRQLALAMAKQGFQISHQTVAELLRHLNYSLQGNAKTQEGKQHPDRDAQFKYINRTVKKHLKNGWPVISVDTKKKELIGQYHRPGKEFRPQGQPERVLAHDFPDPQMGKAIPYGVYDIGENQGWVNVGCDHDTAAFAVESIRRWWRKMGAACYADAARLLICADAGGSNGYRLRLWKIELQKFAREIGIEITVCHFPPGTSKWNKIEHRLFSHITMNWRGQPLISHDVVVNLIGATTTREGLRVKAALDKKKYPKGVKVSDAQMEELNIKPHSFHGEWNYSLKP
jgi:transposase